MKLSVLMLMYYLVKSPEKFWSLFLKKDVGWTESTTKLIRTILVLAIGSSDNERSFSVMNYIKLTRMGILSTMLDALLRIRMNGPKNIEKFRAFDYAKYWVEQQHRTRVDFHCGEKQEKVYTFEDKENFVYFDNSDLF